MRRWLVVVGFLLLPVGWAQAQNGGSEIVIPPAPPVVPEAPSAPPPAPPAATPPPGLVPAAPPTAASNTPPDGSSSADTNAQTVVPAGTPAGTSPTTAATPPPPDVAPTVPNDWNQGTAAVLGVLNKVDGSTSQMQLTVGGPPHNTGDLTVSVQACLSRPAGELPDAAVFVTVTPVQPGSAPIYRGWMLRSAPGAAFVGNAGQAFRVIGCS